MSLGRAARLNPLLLAACLSKQSSGTDAATISFLHSGTHHCKYILLISLALRDTNKLLRVNDLGNSCFASSSPRAGFWGYSPEGGSFERCFSLVEDHTSSLFSFRRTDSTATNGSPPGPQSRAHHRHESRPGICSSTSTARL